MSYDLYLKPRSGTLSADDFKKYFSSRPHYQVDIPSTLYQNEATGVYFVVDYRDISMEGLESKEEQVDAESDEDGSFPIAVNINLFRPSYFIREIEPEITNLVRAFDMQAFDPQIAGESNWEYSREAFVNAWNSSNEFGYSAFLRDGDKSKIHSLASARLHNTWQWNFQKDALQARLGESVFVPSIFFLNIDGGVVTTAVWPDAIPIAAPPVDYYLVMRKDLAPRGWFSAKEDQTLLDVKNVAALFERHRRQTEREYLVLNYLEPPKELREFVRSLPAVKSKFEGISPDQVLDRELVQKFMPSN